MKKILFSLATITALFTGAYAEDIYSNVDRKYIFSTDNFEMPYVKNNQIDNVAVVNCVLHKAQNGGFTPAGASTPVNVKYVLVPNDSIGTLMSCKNKKGEELIVDLSNFRKTTDSANGTSYVILGKYNERGSFDMFYPIKAGMTKTKAYTEVMATDLRN